MQNNVLEVDNKLNSLYNYSHKYIPLEWLEKLGIMDVDQEKVRHIIMTYIVPLLFGLLNFSLTLLFGKTLDKSFIYLIYTVVNSVSAWMGGLTGGLITVFLTVLGNLFISHFLSKQGISVALWMESGALFLNAILLSYLISNASRRNETLVLKEKERIYARTFHEIYDEYTKALGEIKARDQFMSIASHELKTPLTSMLLKLSDMLNRIRNVSLAHFSVQELMQVLQNAQDQIKWLSAMINDLLNVSLMTTGRMDLNRQRLDLAKIVNSVKESFSEVLKNEGYVVTIKANQPVIGYWDNTRIEQAVTNLFSNAIKYGKGNPIDIAVSLEGKTAKFSIHDRGIGINKEDRNILFKPFERPKSVQGYKKGLGVGLYLSHLIAKSHGGDIKVLSQPGKGTTFILVLPVNKKLD